MDTISWHWFVSLMIISSLLIQNTSCQDEEDAEEEDANSPTTRPEREPTVLGLLGSVATLNIPGLVYTSLSFEEEDREVRTVVNEILTTIFCIPPFYRQSSCPQTPKPLVEVTTTTPTTKPTRKWVVRRNFTTTEPTTPPSPLSNSSLWNITQIIAATDIDKPIAV